RVKLAQGLLLCSDQTTALSLSQLRILNLTARKNWRLGLRTKIHPVMQLEKPFARSIDPFQRSASLTPPWSLKTAVLPGHLDMPARGLAPPLQITPQFPLAIWRQNSEFSTNPKVSTGPHH